MFLQVIQGRVTNPQEVRAALDRWVDDLSPGATGWLGSTVGVTEESLLIATVRFTSQRTARANSSRPEQDEWWSETAPLFDGDPAFHDYTETRLSRGGGSDDAGFVQVMHGKVNNPQKAKEMAEDMEDQVANTRPDVIGSVDCWKDNGGFTTLIYFTSEAEARENESKEMPAEAQEQMAEWQAITEKIEYYDLKEPRFIST